MPVRSSQGETRGARGSWFSKNLSAASPSPPHCCHTLPPGVWPASSPHLLSRTPPRYPRTPPGRAPARSVEVVAASEGPDPTASLAFPQCKAWPGDRDLRGRVWGCACREVTYTHSHPHGAHTHTHTHPHGAHTHPRCTARSGAAVEAVSGERREHPIRVGSNGWMRGRGEEERRI